MLLQILLCPILLFTGYRLVNWIRHYLDARKYDVPIILIPVAFDDVWWLPLRPLFTWVEKLPFRLGKWYVYSEMGWPTVDGRRTTMELGETFILCSPSSNQIILCYPPTIRKIYSEHINWPMPAAQGKLFAVYGENVSSAHGAEWIRHRKITSAAFNEHTMNQVWIESIQRARSLHFETAPMSLGKIRATFNVIAMQVLVAVGFGQETDLQGIGPGHRDSLLGCIELLLENVILLLVFGTMAQLPDWTLPRLFIRVKNAAREFGLYMKELVLLDMQHAKSTSTKRSLLSAMIEANEAEKGADIKTGRSSYLTESELYGNLFVFNVAGFETTASTMQFALSYLALHPEVQEWVYKEVETEYKASAPYHAVYPKLVRCLALMYETLRLATPQPLMVRSPTEPRSIDIMTRKGAKSVVVQPGTIVGSHFYGTHLSPRWGKDALEFNPRRFIEMPDGEEKLKVPEGPLFGPWIPSGSRVCPGKKFSQVEFVGLVATILSKYRIEVDRGAGETAVQAQTRLRKVLDEKYFNISAYVKQPAAAAVRIVERQSL